MWTHDDRRWLRSNFASNSQWATFWATGGPLEMNDISPPIGGTRQRALGARRPFGSGRRIMCFDRSARGTKCLAYTALLCASATISEAQSNQNPPAPRVLIESLRVADSLSREAAIQLRAALAARVKPTVLQVVSTDVFDRTKQARRAGLAGQWDWTSVREFARQVAAQYIVDITVVRDSTMVHVAALVVYPARSGEPTPVPLFAQRSLNDAVAQLADHLATRSWPRDR